MSSGFKNKIKFDRQRLEFAYSILLVVLIPAIFAISTVVFTNQYRSNLDRELRKRSDALNTSIGSALGSLSDEQASDYLESSVDTIDDLQRLYVLNLNEQGRFDVAFDTRQTEVDPVIFRQAGLVLSTQQSVSTLTVSSETGDRVWLTFSLINGSAGVIGSEVSLQESDAIAQQTYNRSIIVMVVASLVIVLLLLNHMKFVQYAVLFRKLKELDQMKSDFLNVASHELKAPLTTIRGHVSMVLDGDMGRISKQAKDSLSTVMNSSTQLVNMVEDLLNVSRIEDGRMNYDLVSVNVNSVLKPIVDQYQHRADEKEIKLTYSPNEALWVKADEGKLREICTNLIDNAIKYSKKGSVKVFTELEQGNVAIKVRDEGIGMSASERSQLFKRFSRVRNDDTAHIRGTGLGLWIIKQYAEAMGGSIEVDSIKGEGSLFTVLLPSISKDD